MYMYIMYKLNPQYLPKYVLIFNWNNLYIQNVHHVHGNIIFNNFADYGTC